MTYIIIVAGILILDQLTKLWARTSLTEPITLLPGILQFRYAENRGAAFGMMQDMQWLFVTLTVLVVIAGSIYMYTHRAKLTPSIKLSGMLIIAGGLGNMIDRVFLDYVVDFIYVQAINFPIFNIADISLTLGCALLILLVLFGKERTEENGAD